MLSLTQKPPGSPSLSRSEERAETIPQTPFRSSQIALSKEQDSFKLLIVCSQGCDFIAQSKYAPEQKPFDNFTSPTFIFFKFCTKSIFLKTYWF